MRSKTCSKCKILKLVKEFNKQKNTKDGLRYWCTQCCTEYQKQRHNNNPSRKRQYDLTRNYGITEEDYSKLLYNGKECCYICGIHQSMLDRKLGVDHNHTTKKVRGLLCNGCNYGLGKFKDSKKLLEAAIAYLVKYG